MNSSISPSIWDDPEFIRLSHLEKLTWFFLLTCHEGTLGCPGLVVMTTGGAAEGLREASQDVEVSLAKLEALEWIDRDQTRRLIRVPNAPKEQGKVNGNVLKGWFRRWGRIPDCELKFAHVASMRACAPDGGPAWSETFGSVPVLTQTTQPPPLNPQLLLVPGSHDNSSGKAFQRLEKAAVAEAGAYAVAGEEAEAEAGRPTARVASRQEYSDDGSSSGRRGGTADASARASRDASYGAVADASPPAARDVTLIEAGNGSQEGLGLRTIMELWERLQDRRADVGLPRMAPGPGSLSAIQGLLSGHLGGPFSIEQLEHAVDAAGLRAKGSPDVEWLLNGVDTWSPRVIQRNLGARAKPRAARGRGKDLAAFVNKKYGGTGAEN